MHGMKYSKYAKDFNLVSTVQSILIDTEKSCQRQSTKSPCKKCTVYIQRKRILRVASRLYIRHGVPCVITHIHNRHSQSILRSKMYFEIMYCRPPKCHHSTPNLFLLWRLLLFQKFFNVRNDFLRVHVGSITLHNSSLVVYQEFGKVPWNVLCAVLLG